MPGAGWNPAEWIVLLPALRVRDARLKKTDYRFHPDAELASFGFTVVA
jgi:hypothetical protein